MLKEAKGVEGEYPVLQHLSLKIVVFSKIQYRCLGTSGSSASLILWGLIGQCKTQTADCRPGVKCRLRVKCRLQTRGKMQTEGEIKY